MTTRSTRVAVALLAAGLLAVAAGCGGGSKKSVSPPAAVTHRTTATVQTKTTTNGSTPDFASAKNCRDMASLAARAAAAIAASGNANNVLETEAREVQALATSAPSDIRGDFQTFATAFSGFLHTLQKSGYKIGSKAPPTAAQAAAFARAAKSFDTPKLRRAEQHLSTWAQQNCKGVNVGG